MEIKKGRVKKIGLQKKDVNNLLYIINKIVYKIIRKKYNISIKKNKKKKQFVRHSTIYFDCYIILSL